MSNSPAHPSSLHCHHLSLGWLMSADAIPVYPFTPVLVVIPGQSRSTSIAHQWSRISGTHIGHMSKTRMSCFSHSWLCRNGPELPLLPRLRSDSAPSCLLWEIHPQLLPQLQTRGRSGGVDSRQRWRVLHRPGLRPAELLPGCEWLSGVGHGGFWNLLPLEPVEKHLSCVKRAGPEGKKLTWQQKCLCMWLCFHVSCMKETQTVCTLIKQSRKWWLVRCFEPTCQEVTPFLTYLPLARGCAWVLRNQTRNEAATSSCCLATLSTPFVLVQEQSQDCKVRCGHQIKITWRINIFAALQRLNFITGGE